MDLIVLSDGMYYLVPVTKELTAGIELFSEINCFDLCDMLRLKLTTYIEPPLNAYIMNDGSGDFYGCICK